MSLSTEEYREIVAVIGDLRSEIQRLSDRVALLEGGSSGRLAETPEEPIDEELVLVISAAIAAFVGKRPRIRQIRLLGSTSWAQQGRIAVQASHALDLRHG